MLGCGQGLIGRAQRCVSLQSSAACQWLSLVSDLKGGNHELNALALHSADPDNPGEHLRPHTEKNTRQHAETLRQLLAGELASYLDWFRPLPLWLDLDGLRVVHACWDETRMARISGLVTDEFLHAACSPNGSLFEPVEAILKGKEVRLPSGDAALTRPVNAAGDHWAVAGFVGRRRRRAKGH